MLKEKRGNFLYHLFGQKEIFLTCVLSQCILYQIHLQYILLHIEKHYFIHFCCLVLKLLKAFSVSLIKALIQTMKKKEEHVFCGLSNLKFHKFLKVTNPSLRKEICKKNKNCPVYFEIGHMDIYVPNKIINRKTVMVNIILQAHGNRLGGRGWGAAAPQIFAKFYFFMN